MLLLVEKIIPIIILSVIAYILKIKGLFKIEAGDILMRLVYYLAGPTLIYLSVSKLTLNVEYILLPISSALIITVLYLTGRILGKWQNLGKQQYGTFVLGSIIINTFFLIPFIFIFYGNEGFALLTMFDLSNAAIVYSFGYYLAVKYSSQSNSTKLPWKKIFFSPPLWAFLLGLCANIFHFNTPQTITSLFSLVGETTIPLLMIALGFYFSPKTLTWKPIFWIIFLRFFVGIIIGFIIVEIFQFQGLTRSIVIVGATTPVGYNTILFASLENLDKELAAGMVSYSILVGIFVTPIIMLLL